jgi:beta-lactam-binding protein with PASTA domain
VGMTFTEARLLLVSDGFTVRGRHTRLGQVVTRTNPAAGEVPAGSLIIVVYGTGTLLLRATVPAVRARTRGQRGSGRRRPIHGAEQPSWIAAPSGNDQDSGPSHARLTGTTPGRALTIGERHSRFRF